jgi:hypothetical protein
MMMIDNDESLLDSVDFVHTLRQQHASSLPHNRLIQTSSATLNLEDNDDDDSGDDGDDDSGDDGDSGDDEDDV